MAFHSFQNPLQNADVFAVTGPQKLSISTFAEPVHMKNLRRFWYFPAHIQPVLEIVRHVVTAEWEHGHWIAARNADIAGRCRSRLAGHGCANEDPMLPVIRLVNERRNARSSTA